MLVVGGGGAVGQTPEQQPEDLCCPGEEEVKEAFGAAMDAFHGASWRQAADSLCRAACCWPHPDATQWQVKLYGTAYYLPFFYLSAYHQKEERPAEALENASLSVCEGEITSHSRYLRLRRHLEEIRAWARSERSERAPRHPEFSRALGDGRRASDPEHWAEAARTMQRALERWGEDGELVRSQGRWLGRYLPRLHLGRFLFEMGCYQEAIHLVRCSRISRCLFEGTDLEEGRAIREILREGTRRLEQGYEEPPICEEWRSLRTPMCCQCARCERP
jgi:hypothetical protein